MGKKYVQITMSFKPSEWEELQEYFPDEVNKSAVAKKFLKTGISVIQKRRKKRG